MKERNKIRKNIGRMERKTKGQGIAKPTGEMKTIKRSGALGGMRNEKQQLFDKKTIHTLADIVDCCDFRRLVLLL